MYVHLYFWLAVDGPKALLIVEFQNLSIANHHKLWNEPAIFCEVCSRFSFVWNRTKSVFDGSNEIPAKAVLDDLSKCAERNPDVIVEVAHPSITKQVSAADVLYCD